MEPLLVLLALGLTVGLPITVVVLLVRVAALTRRVAATEARLRVLRSEVSGDHVVGPTGAAPPVSAAVPSSPQPSPARPGGQERSEPRPMDPESARPAATELGLALSTVPDQGPGEVPPPLPRTATQASRTAPSTPAPPRTGPPKSSRPAEIDWERWLGIRGAAVVGGIALILSGFFFVQVAIERGWLGPAARDTLAAVVGALALAAHRPLISRGYRTLGESVGGAGAVLIYGAAWAASRLHGLVPEWLALLVMTATTGIALLFSIRAAAPILASFALVGGFATPLLLNTFEQGATTLFGYVLVLDMALLAIARIRRWAWMLPLAALGTAIIQFTWVVVQGKSLDPWVSALVLGGFALAFSASRATDWGDGRNRGLVHLTLLLAVFAPFALTIVQTAQSGEGTSLWPRTVLLGVLLTCAAIASRRFKSPADTILAAVVAALSLAFASVRLRLAYLGSGDDLPLDGLWIQWAISAVALAGLQFALGRIGAPRAASFAFALLSLLLAHELTTIVAPSDVPRAFALTCAALAAFGVASCSFRGWQRQCGALIGGAAGFALMRHADAVYRGPLPFDAPLTLALPILVIIALVAAAFGSRSTAKSIESVTSAARTFAAFVVVVPLLLLQQYTGGPSTLVQTAILLTAGVAAAITLQREGRWTPGALLAQCGAAAAAVLYWFDHARFLEFDGSANGLLAVTVVICSVAPVGLTLARKLDGSLAHFAAWAVILPAATLPFGPAGVVRAAHDATWAFHATLLIPALFAIAAGLVMVRRDDVQRAANVLLAAGVALAGVSLSHYFAAQWTVTSAAITGGAFAFFCGRARSTGPAGLGAALAAATTLVLVVLTFLDGAFLAEPLYVPLQVTIDHGLVAASLVAAALGMRRLAADEPARTPLFVTTSVALLVVLFAWVNAVVLNHFATGDRIILELERMQARDLTLSLSWAGFGGTLLCIGLARRVAGLRWASLVVLIATVLKVFLYDLGALTGLSRVGSFLGLAVCLFLVSMVYARVLGRDFERPRGAGDTLPPHDADVPTNDSEGVAPPGRD